MEEKRVSQGREGGTQVCPGRDPWVSPYTMRL